MHSESGFVTTLDGVRLFFEMYGRGSQTVIWPNGLYLVEDFRYLAEGRTMIFYDVRNRGRSDAVTELEKIKDGIHHDVDDLDAVRQHFGVSRVNLIGHSYAATTVMLYAMKHPDRVNRAVLMGPMAPDQRTRYPAHLQNVDHTLQEALAKIGDLQKERGSMTPEDFCRKFWSILNVIYVADPADVHKINWSRCECANERNLMKPLTEFIMPSIQRLDLTAEDMARVKAPVLIVHGTKDRSSPYGGARDWSRRLPDARLVTVENAAHGPWIEDPECVFGSVETFLDGMWPAIAQKVEAL
jgi:pimeloyl-ACP methyl ester carboxylesterase